MACMVPILGGVVFLCLAVPVVLAEVEPGDAVRGEKVFRACKVCHQVGPSAGHRIGPELNGVIGRVAGTMEGYTYSSAMKAAGQAGLEWTEETLGAYLENPREYIVGNKMVFVGLRRPKRRRDVIAYLRGFGGDGLSSQQSDSPALPGIESRSADR